MLKQSTTSIARHVAESLGQNRTRLRVKADHLPVGIVANELAVGVADKRTTSGDYPAMVQRFRSANASVSALVGEQFDELVELMSDGLRRMLHTARNVIVPYCKEVKSDYDMITEQERLPKIQIKPFVFHPIHDEDTLTHHLVERYSRWPVQETYRTFVLDRMPYDALREGILTTEYAPKEMVADWLTRVSEEDLMVIFFVLFERREIPAADIGFLRGATNMTAIDQLLAAYLLTGWLRDNPQDVIGESVDIDTWTKTLDRLHALFGSHLLLGYQRRVKLTQDEQIVLEYQSLDPIREGSLTVITNGDTYAEWLEQGGDVKVLLGAAVADPARKTAKALAADQEELIRIWDRKHHVMRQTVLDRFFDNQRRLLSDLLKRHMGNDSEVTKDLPEVPKAELHRRIDEHLRGVRPDAMDDLWTVIVQLVCAAYYPNTPYSAYLTEMEAAKRRHGDLNARECALMATVVLVSTWLGDQIEAKYYEPENLPLPATHQGAVVESVPNEEAVAEDEPEKAEPEVTEDDETVSTEPTEAPAEEPVTDESTNVPA